MGCELPGVGAGYGTWSSGRTVHSIECWTIFIASNLMTSFEVLQEKKNEF